MRAAVNISEVLFNFNAKLRNLVVVESSKQQFKYGEETTRVSLTQEIRTFFEHFSMLICLKVFFKRKL